MLENEVRELRTHRFEPAEEPEGRLRARRELAGDVHPGRCVGGVEPRGHDVGESLDGRGVIGLRCDEMVRRDAKPDPAIPGAFAERQRGEEGEVLECEIAHRRDPAADDSLG